MANNNDLIKLNNQEVIFEEINEEELDGVVGGILPANLNPAFNFLFNIVGSLQQFAVESGLSIPPQQ